ncbi:MAG: CRTAC1 family protein [Gemmataceae bacterium]|nr:CRTAC1 family protein [Gemmataceae bacterium]
MSKPVKQALIAVFFLAQMAAVVWLNRKAEGDHDDKGEAEAHARYGFYLRESAQEMGIGFKHEGPKDLDKKLEHILPLIASMGAGVSIVDFDKDGLLDIYAVTSREGGKNALFRNLGDGKFVDVAAEVGLADVSGGQSCQGAVWGDFDNDGWEDVLVYKWGKPELFRNVGGKRFENVTAKANLPAHVNCNAAVWLDFDSDGLLDLLITGYWAEDVDLWNLETTRIMPESFKYAKNGGRKYLLKNLGGGAFKDVTKEMGLESTRWTLGAAAADLCGSGYPDIILANDYGVSEYWCNRGGKKFEQINRPIDFSEKPESGMNVSFGDIHNNGVMGVYITNITSGGNIIQNNKMWTFSTKPQGEPVRMADQSEQLKINDGGWAWGAQFGDLNNDGRQDLFVNNGNISASKEESYWFDYNIIAGANTQTIIDAAKWPPMRGRSLSGHESKRVWLNRGGGLPFSEPTGAVGVKTRLDGRAVAFADLLNRGVLDVVSANQHGPLHVYRNSVKPGRGWIQFDLEGTKSNRSAIGAVVTLHWSMKGAPKQAQAQAVTGGNGHASQTMRRLHFGLGEEARIEKAVIRWPSGRVQSIDAPTANANHKIKEPAE